MEYLLILLAIIIICILYLSPITEQMSSGNGNQGGRGQWALSLTPTLENFNNFRDELYKYVDNYELQMHPQFFNQKKIITPGILTIATDVSTLNSNIWVDYAPGAEIVHYLKDKGYSIYRVKIWGTFQQMPRNCAGFGYKGNYKNRIIVDKMVYYDQIGGENYNPRLGALYPAIRF
jgi:hypothetical protein